MFVLFLISPTIAPRNSDNPSLWPLSSLNNSIAHISQIIAYSDITQNLGDLVGLLECIKQKLPTAILLGDHMKLNKS